MNIATEEQEKAEWAKLVAPINPIKNALDGGDDVTAEFYQAQEEGVKRGDPRFVMSRGELMEFARCPHRWLMGYKEDGSNATEWGQLIDCLALCGPQMFQARFAVCPSTYTNDDDEEKPWNGNAKVCRAWKATMEEAGKQIVKNETAIAAQNAVKFLFADPQIRELLQCSRRQVMLTGEYHDEETGLVIPLKGLVDLIPAHDSPYGACLADLKTCNSAAPRAWARAVFDHAYDAQSALYVDLWNAARPDDQRNEFRHILQESYAPWQKAKRILSSEYLSVGRARYVNALKRYAQCLKTGTWPDYDEPRSNADIAIDGWLVVPAEAWMIMAT